MPLCTMMFNIISAMHYRVSLFVDCSPARDNVNGHKCGPMKIVYLYICAVLISIGGCTSQQAFEGIKAKNMNDCYNLPYSQRDECLATTDISYEEYQRRRKETEESASSH